MSTQREEDAKEYLKEHKILELMDNMTSMLLFYRPENPQEFLIEQLVLLKESRESGTRGPNLFDNSNLTAMYGIMDPANQKYISFAQYKHALTMLGIKNINLNPEGRAQDKLSQEVFKAEAMQLLTRDSATYAKL